MTRTFPLKAIAHALFLSVVLSGCYLPIRYDAEITLYRTGHYEFIFDGYLARVELFQGLKEGKIDAAEEKIQIELIRRDMARDKGVKEFKYIKMGHFKVNWAYKGDLLKVKSVSFFNPSSEYMLGIRYNSKTRLTTMAGKSLALSTKKELDKLGLTSTGQIRVYTDAKVISHNANKVQKNKRLGGRFMTYTWNIKNLFAPTPKLVLQPG